MPEGEKYYYARLPIRTAEGEEMPPAEDVATWLSIDLTNKPGDPYFVDKEEITVWESEELMQLDLLEEKEKNKNE